MPANLTPQYLEAEKAYKEAATDDERVRCLEQMLRQIPKHKGTEHMQGDIRRRISKLKQQMEQEQAKARKSHSWKIRKEGAGQIALAGRPNIGKSAMVGFLTNAAPEVADYPFTTRRPMAAMMPYLDVKVQLIDLPPLSEDYEEHWVIDLLKAAEVVLVVVDLSTDPLSELSFCLERMAQKKLAPLKDGADQDLLITRPMLVAGTRLDLPDSRENLEIFRELDERGLPIFPVSSLTGEGMDKLKTALWEILKVIRVYSKAPGRKPDMDVPYVLPAGSTVLDFAEAVHREIAENLKFARIWSGNKYDGQMVNREELLADGDILELHS